MTFRGGTVEHIQSRDTRAIFTRPAESAARHVGADSVLVAAHSFRIRYNFNHLICNSIWSALEYPVRAEYSVLVRGPACDKSKNTGGYWVSSMVSEIWELNAVTYIDDPSHVPAHHLERGIKNAPAAPEYDLEPASKTRAYPVLIRIIES